MNFFQVFFCIKYYEHIYFFHILFKFSYIEILCCKLLWFLSNTGCHEFTNPVSYGKLCDSFIQPVETYTDRLKKIEPEPYSHNT